MKFSWKNFPEMLLTHDPKSEILKKVWKNFPRNPLSDHPIFGNIFQDLSIWVKELKDCFVQFSSATQWRLVTTISRTKRSFGVILAVFGNFCKTETAYIGAISWVDIGSVQPALSILKKLARWHPIQKSYSRF